MGSTLNLDGGSPSSPANYQTIQQDTLKIHQKFLENDAEYTRLFGQLTQQELALINTNAPQAAMEQVNTALQTLDRSIAQFHQHQAETLRVHEQFLMNQVTLLNTSGVVSPAAISSNSILTRNARSQGSQTEGIKTEVLSTDLSEPQLTNAGGIGSKSKLSNTENTGSQSVKNIGEVARVDARTLTSVLLEIVSEKTGYPTEMLELTMDMEADLGIDSIKRVEILGAMQTRFPELPKADATALSEMRTLGQIVDYMSASVPANIASGAQKTSTDTSLSAENPIAEVVQTNTSSPNFSLDGIKTALLEIVSEKTGYPTEMLEMGMDMEADLGIDSIKRVEILGAMQERFPELPKADAAMLAEMRTLGQIINHLSSAPSDGLVQADKPVTTLNTASPETETKDQNILSTDPAQSSDGLMRSLLEVVSEKTGYPTEMLDLGMDMEADLGIDSIKRVEILGAMQEKYPELPQADAAVLAELHTLQQIMDSFSQPSSSSPVQKAIVQKHDPLVPDLIRGVVSLKSLPMPDQLEIKTPADQLALIVDDGTELTTKLAEKLVSNGNKVVVLALPETKVSKRTALPKNVERSQLVDFSENAIQSVIETIEKKYGHAGIFIHLDPANSGSEDFSESEKSIVKTIFLIAKHLKEGLTLSAKSGYAAFLTVSHLDGQFGLSKGSDVEPVSGGLFGLTKTLNLEWDDVFCRAIDLQPEMDADLAAKHIVAELSDPNRLISEVAYTENGRFTLEVQIPESEAQS